VPVTLTAGVLILLTVTVIQLRVIIKSSIGVRAIEALSATVSLFCCCLPRPLSRWRTPTRRTSARIL
jgi:hypothetical protein